MIISHTVKHPQKPSEAEVAVVAVTLDTVSPTFGHLNSRAWLDCPLVKMPQFFYIRLFMLPSTITHNCSHFHIYRSLQPSGHSMQSA